MTTQKRQGFFARLAVLDPAPPWSLLGAAFTILAAFVCFAIGGILGLLWLGEQSLSTLFGWCIGALAAAFIVTRTRSKPKAMEALGVMTRGGTPIPFLLFLGLGLAVTVDLISAAVSGSFQMTPELIGISLRTGGIGTWLVAIVFMVFLQPVAEELVFRGVFFPSIRVALGPWGGLLISALAYAAFHFLIYPPAYANVAQSVSIWYGLGAPLLQGLVFSATRARTRSTSAAIVMHAAFGLFAILKLAVLGA